MTYLRRILAILSARRWSPSVEIDRSGRGEWTTAIERLSPRQRQVLRSLARGRSYTETAGDLGMTEHTVKAHVVAIYEALEAQTREEAYAAVGWLRVPEEAA